MAAMFARRSGRARVRRVLEHAGPEVVECRRPQQHGGTDEIDAGDGGIAVGADVVGDDEAAVRPGDDHRTLEASLVDDRGEVVCPQPLVGVAAGIERLLGHAVPAVVERDHSEARGERTADLGAPAQVALRPAVDEQDRRARRDSPIHGRGA